MGEHSAKLYLRYAGSGCDLVLKRGALANLHCFADTQSCKVLLVAGKHTPGPLVECALRQCQSGKLCLLEKNQGMQGVEQVLAAMCEHGMSQQDLVVALGGQSVQGTACLAAGLYQGGVNLVSCPSTVCAQLCACGNAKRGVELTKPGFWAMSIKAPALVLVDPALPESESEANRTAGLAWALQIALCCDPRLLPLLEAAQPDYDEILWRTLQNKKNLMDQNPAGVSPALECGTGLAQALWQVYGLRGRRTRGLLPGECLALALEGVIEEKALARQVRAICRNLGLPARAAWNREKVLEALLQAPGWKDGKRESVVITGPGCWKLRTLSLADVQQEMGTMAQKEE